MSTSTFPDIGLLKRFSKNVEWYQNNLNELLQYDGMYLAVYNQDVMDTDFDISNLLDRIRNHPDRKAIYVTQLIHRDNSYMI